MKKRMISMFLAIVMVLGMLPTTAFAADDDNPGTTVTVTAFASPEEGATISGAGTYQSGDSVTLTATVKRTHTFKGWQDENGNIVCTTFQYTFTATEDCVLTAVLEESGSTLPSGGSSGSTTPTKPTIPTEPTKPALPTTPTEPTRHTIIVSADSAERGTVSGEGIYADGTSVTVTATPNEGYKFSRWMENGINVSRDASYTFTADADRTLTAVFAASDIIDVDLFGYTVTLSSNSTLGGNYIFVDDSFVDDSLTGLISGQMYYLRNESCTVFATTNEGYTFVGWELNGSIVSTDAIYTFTGTVGSTYNLVAVFEKSNTDEPVEPTRPNIDPSVRGYTVFTSASPTEGGTVTGKGVYRDGASVTVTALPNEGYIFWGWREDVSLVSTDAEYTFTVSGHVNLVANFVLCMHTGGTATCTQQAVCDRCNVGYGDVNPDNHTGGTATCAEQAVCDRCGVGYGDVNPDNHIFGDDHCCTNEGCSAAEECTLTFIDGNTRTEVEAHYHDLFYFDLLPDKDGLTFLGWDEDGDGVVDYEGYDYIYLYGSQTYTAIYGAMYLVSYYRIGYDSGEYELQDSVTVSENGTLTLSYDYAYWYTPLGWATEPGGEKVYDFGQEITVTDTLNLYTVWMPFTATFDLDGGTWLDEEGTPVPETITEDTTFYTVPTKPGYLFQHFAGIDQYGSEITESLYTDEETGESWISIYINAKITYTAVWAECTEHNYAKGKCTICGYECEHWYVNDECNRCGARKIPFSSSFGKGLTKENDVAFPGETFSTKITSVTGKLANYAKIRIDQEDYYLGDSPVTYIDGILTIPGDLITGRVWVYFNAGIDITFHTNGGAFVEELEATGDSYTTDGNYSDKEYRYGDDFVMFEQLFVREGYELTGLNSKADGSGIAYDDDTMFTLTQDLDFYAQWRCLHAKGFETTDDGNFKCNTCGMTAPIVITAEPEDVSVPYNETALSTVVALGEGLTYQWYYKDVDDEDFIKSIYTGDTYSLIMYKGRNNREVYCIITDANGNSVTTRTATLSIDPQNAVQIVTQPADVSADYNEKAVATVVATGDGLTYQWYYKDAHHEDFQKSVYKTNEYSLIMYKGRDGREVYCEITDAYGNTVKSNIVTLSIAPQNGIVITQQPADVSVAYNETALTTVVAEGEGLTYQWYFKDEGSTGFVKSQYTGDTYSLIMYKGRNNRQVYCEVTDTNGNTVATDIATLTIQPQNKVQIVTQPIDASADYNEKAVTTVVATGDGLTYQWFYKDVDDEAFIRSIYKVDNYSLIMYEGRDGREVYCEITDAYGNTVETAHVTLTINK